MTSTLIHIAALVAGLAIEAACFVTFPGQGMKGLAKGVGRHRRDHRSELLLVFREDVTLTFEQPSEILYHASQRNGQPPRV
jgi:hypothetical protein